MLVKVPIAGAQICLGSDLGASRMLWAAACSVCSEIMHHICDGQ